jgi:hypothetical protein
MSAVTTESPEAPKAATHIDPASAAKALATHWRGRAAEIGASMAEAQTRLEELEGEAATAALEGQPLPEMGGLEAELRALKRARQLAMEKAEMADEEAAAARRASAAEAAAALAPRLVAEAAALDDCLAELGHRLTTLARLARQQDQLARAGGVQRRRSADAISISALAGAILHNTPELFELLQCPRPTQDSRQPLAAHMARRHGLGPQEVTQ